MSLFFSEDQGQDLVLRRTYSENLADRVIRIRVATFRSFGSHDTVLWRFVRRTAGEPFEHVRLTFRPQGHGNRTSRDFGEFGTPDYVEVDFDDDPVSKLVAVRAMRWVLPLLGLVEPMKGPLPQTRQHVAPDIYVGRFRGQTAEEVLRDAAVVDEELRLSSRVSADFATRKIFGSHGTRLFFNRTSIGSTWTLLGPRDDQTLFVYSGRSPFLIPFVRRLLLGDDQMPFVVLPGDDLERWWHENSLVGELSMPIEELELYRTLGERTPYLWPAAEVSQWAIERWGGGT